MTLSDFQGEEAVGFEGGEGLGDEAAVNVQAGCSGEEGCGWLVIADLGVEGFAVGCGDIGRVGDEYFVLFSTRYFVLFTTRYFVLFSTRFARECGGLSIPLVATR